MAYRDNYYPQNYSSYGNYGYNQPQPMYQMNTQPQATQQVQVQTQDDRMWVASQTAAEAYPMMQPNGFIRLWDSNKPYYYEKRADASGRPLPMLAYEYHIVTDEPATETTSDFEKRLAALESKIANIEQQKGNKLNFRKGDDRTNE